MRTLQIRLAIILALASLTAAVPNALAQNGCTPQLLAGSFSYASQSLAATGPIMIFLPIGSYSPFALAGTITFDGIGNLTGADMVNLGSGGVNRTYTGTYAVVDRRASLTNCAFVASFTAVYPPQVPPTTPTSFNMYMVLAHGGTVLELVDTDPGFIYAFKAEKK